LFTVFLGFLEILIPTIMKNKRIVYVVLLPLLVLIVLLSCEKKDKNKPNSDSIIEGQTSILVDETLLPIVDDQVTIFESEYDAKITLIPKSEMSRSLATIFAEILNKLIRGSDESSLIKGADL
jgi:hypothetical protein